MHRAHLLVDLMRGLVWAVYIDDDGRSWSRRVDADQVDDPGRGWSSEDVTNWLPLPRGWLPRKVRGLDEEGRTGFAVVASVEAPLWTGAQSTFTIEGTDQLPHEAIVVERFAERQVLSKARPTTP
jgi:hypothetical protein